MAKKKPNRDHALPQRGFGLSTPSEAERKGATPSQGGMQFSIVIQQQDYLSKRTGVEAVVALSVPYCRWDPRAAMHDQLLHDQPVPDQLIGNTSLGWPKNHFFRLHWLTSERYQLRGSVRISSC
jgi:hypothetical protein